MFLFLMYDVSQLHLLMKQCNNCCESTGEGTVTLKIWGKFSGYNNCKQGMGDKNRKKPCSRFIFFITLVVSELFYDVGTAIAI